MTEKGSFAPFSSQHCLKQMFLWLQMKERKKNVIEKNN
jgi:hypothetical protein